MLWIEHGPSADPYRLRRKYPRRENLWRPLRVRFAHSWSRLHHDRSRFWVTGFFDERNVPVHFLRIDKVTIRRFAAAAILGLDGRKITDDGNGDALVRFDLCKLLCRPVRQRLWRMSRIRQCLYGLPRDFVILAGRVS